MAEVDAAIPRDEGSGVGGDFCFPTNACTAGSVRIWNPRVILHAPDGSYQLPGSKFRCAGQMRNRFGPRGFPDMSVCPTASACERSPTRLATACGVRLKEGIYACMAGPSFETPRLRSAHWGSCGADAVGMSTVPECIRGPALRHSGGSHFVHHEPRRGVWVRRILCLMERSRETDGIGVREPFAQLLAGWRRGGPPAPV